MNSNIVISDQLYNWSANDTKKNIFPVAREKKESGSTTIETRGICPSWFFDRALQTVWETGVQMRQDSRPWAKVLFINQLPQEPTRNGLCTFGIQRTGKEIFRELSHCARYPKRDLHDQSRTSTAKREVRGISERYGLPYSIEEPERVRYSDGGSFSCQYARGLSGMGHGTTFFRGGLC